MEIVFFGLKMNEILSILAQLFIFLFFFSTPVNLFNKNLLFKNTYISLFDCILLNIFFHLNLFLFISFLNINIEIYYFSILIINLLFHIFFLKKYLNIKIILNKIYPFLIFLFLCIALFFDISANIRLEWDALSHWIFKARNFYDGETIQNLKNLQFPEYPHLGTFVWGFFWKNSFLEYEYSGRLFYVLFYLLSLASINQYIFKKNLYLFGISYLFFIILTYDTFMFSGYQEYLVFSTLVVISRFILIFRTNLKYFLILIFISHLLMWFKDEGLFYFIIFNLSILYYSKLFLKEKLSVFLIILILPILQFFLQSHLIGNFSFQADLLHNDLKYLLDFSVLFTKIILITKFIIISIIKYKIIIVYLLSTFFLYLIIKKDLGLIKFFLVCFVLNYGLFFAIYLHTPHDIEFLLRVTLDRLVFQTSGFYLIIILLTFRKLFQTFNNRFI